MKDPEAARPHLVACVDDDAAILEALEGLLRAFQYEVLTFASAEALLDCGEIASIACIIADIRLGGRSGLQLQEELIARGHVIPTIIITAFAEAGYRTAAVKAGAVDFLPKPISPERLLKAVAVALGNDEPAVM